MALLKQTLECLQNIDKILEAYSEASRNLPSLPVGYRDLPLARKFHLVMTHGATFDRQGILREQFYKNVLQKAQSRSKDASIPAVPSVATQTSTKVDVALEATAQSLVIFAQKHDQAVVFALDEVHGLFTPLQDDKRQTVFHCL